MIVRRAFTAPGWKLGGYWQFVERTLVILVTSLCRGLQETRLDTLGLLMALNHCEVSISYRNISTEVHVDRNGCMLTHLWAVRPAS